MNNYNRIYELTYEKLNTMENLLNHIRSENYSEVSFSKNVEGYFAVLTYSSNELNYKFECQFDSTEKLSTIYRVDDNNKKLIFDRSYELIIEKAIYLEEYQGSVFLEREQIKEVI